VSDQKPSHVTKALILCRIDEGKTISGLCLGVGTRAEARVDWLPTVAFFLLLLTGGLLGVAYLIALLLLPAYAP
jgi:phage shock protein PspC (stress-responsive transcriptional regulator)